MPEGKFFSFLKSGCPKSDFESVLAATRETTRLHQALAKGVCDRNELITAYNDDLKGTRFSSGALFLSAEEEYASRFAKGAVLQFETSRSQLENLLASGALYAGLETGTEFAFIGPVGLDALLNDFVEARPAKQGINFVGDGASHPIWR